MRTVPISRERVDAPVNRTSAAQEIIRRFRDTLQTGGPHVVPEFIALRKDRQVLEYYEWRINRIPLPGGRLGVVCYFRDVSKSVLAREALRSLAGRTQSA